MHPNIICANWLEPGPRARQGLVQNSSVSNWRISNNKFRYTVYSFNYLGNIVSYEKELDIDNKLHNYLKITGIINNVFRPQKPLKKTRIRLYNTLAFPVLLYGS